MSSDAAVSYASEMPSDLARFLNTIFTTKEHDVVCYYLKLVAQNGWSLRRISAVVGVSAETIRTRIRDVDINHSCALSDAPEIPMYQPLRKQTVVKKSRYVIPDEVADEMKALRLSASKVSRFTPEDSHHRVDSERMTQLMLIERSNGATYQEIAVAAGLTSWATVKFRLGRHGFTDLPPSMLSEAII